MGSWPRLGGTSPVVVVVVVARKSLICRSLSSSSKQAWDSIAEASCLSPFYLPRCCVHRDPVRFCVVSKAGWRGAGEAAGRPLAVHGDLPAWKQQLVGAISKLLTAWSGRSSPLDGCFHVAIPGGVAQLAHQLSVPGGSSRHG